MAPRPPRSRAWDTLLRTLRFFYLLWGGMLMISMALSHRMRLPDFLWEWPRFARFLGTSWGRALLLGLGVTMALAALLEVWELVDRLLVQFMHEHERER